MADHILFVFEGAKTEKQVYDNLKQYYLNEFEHITLIGVYCSNIYSLYQIVQKDPDLDLLLLLQEHPENQKLLSGVSREDISEVFLFFDYDGHDTNAKYEKLDQMLSYFNEETDAGKLYLSYPMVEAIKHLREDTDFKDVLVESCKTYKNLVSKNCERKYINITQLTKEHWVYIVSEHCKKLNHLVDDLFILPSRHISQEEVLKQQKDKHITPNNQVAVLSAFPVFIVDYYGYENLPALLETV